MNHLFPTPVIRLAFIVPLAIHFSMKREHTPMAAAASATLIP